jgi:hypothetical protein
MNDEAQVESERTYPSSETGMSGMGDLPGSCPLLSFNPKQPIIK